MSIQKIKLALIWPHGFDPHYAVPLPFAYFKSNLDPDRFDVRILDCALEGISSKSPVFEEWIKDFSPQFVGISSWSPMFPEAISIAAQTKELLPKVTTFVGGAHATSYWQQVMENDCFDYLYRGEAELELGRLLEAIHGGEHCFDEFEGLVYRKQDGSLAINGITTIENLDDVKWPDYDFIRLDQYLQRGYRWNGPSRRNAPIWVTRGCPYKCTFCSAPQLNGRDIRAHSVSYMKKWISHLYHEKGIRWLNIIDDNFTFEVNYAKKFCQGLLQMGLTDLQFGTPNGIRMQMGDFELWQLMKQVGWTVVMVAPESGSEETLRRMKKSFNVEKAPKIVSTMQEAGLKVHAFFILGYPGDKMKDIKETVKFIKNCKFDFVFFNVFQPLPGTPIYDQLVKEGKIEDGLLPKNYSEGIPGYITEGLESFNFSRFILLTYILLFFKKPSTLLYVFQAFSLPLILKKLFRNVGNGFLHNATSSSTS